MYRSSHRRCSVKKGVLKNVTNFTEKHLCWKLQHRCFPVKFAKFLRTSILKNVCERLSQFVLTTLNSLIVQIKLSITSPAEVLPTSSIYVIFAVQLSARTIGASNDRQVTTVVGFCD